MHFTNLEQRMIHAYLDLFPPFHPLAEGGPPVTSQAQFYRFMQGVYQALFSAPELFFKQINADDAFPNRFNLASYGKPKLKEAMKRDLKEIEALLAQLFACGQGAVVEDGRLILAEGVEVKKKFREFFPQLGLALEGRALATTSYEGLFPAWQWLASRESASVLAFARCQFDPASPSLEMVYAPLFGHPQVFNSFFQQLKDCGYARFELVRGAYTLDYVKRVGKKEAQPGTPMHGDPLYYGVSLDYRPEVTDPQYLVLRILDMRNILPKFESLAPGVQRFLFQHIKKCDDCKYCTQTDKTGMRKPLAVTIQYEGSEHRLCPLYPGFNFSFSELTEALAADLLTFLAFQEAHLADGHYKG